MSYFLLLLSLAILGSSLAKSRKGLSHKSQTKKMRDCPIDPSLSKVLQSLKSKGSTPVRLPVHSFGFLKRIKLPYKLTPVKQQTYSKLPGLKGRKGRSTPVRLLLEQTILVTCSLKRREIVVI